MKILIAPDKFKGSLTAQEVAEAIENGISKSLPDAQIFRQPLADGGDGSLDLMANFLRLKKVQREVSGPLGRPVQAIYAIGQGIACVELAQASGLVLLGENQRRPTQTSTLGSGELIRDAILSGAKKIYLLIGGSATNDAAMGIAHALGYRFLDENRKVLSPKGGHLVKLRYIDNSLLMPLKDVSFHILCDVDNPLYGPKGAAFVYGPQKGASPSMVKKLNQGLRQFAKVVQRRWSIDVQQIKGGGAAGGVGAGMAALFGAEILGGFETIAQMTQLDKQIKAADNVISGEGGLDDQSLQGKV
ncbi:MAG: glycerate kinase, partial [Bacteroidota bacterium]